MRKPVIYGVVIFLVLGIYFIIDSNPSITTASVWGTSRCISPAEALGEINNKGCERINIGSSHCEDDGMVEIRCPIVESTPAETPEPEEGGTDTTDISVSGGSAGQGEKPSRMDVFRSRWRNRFSWFFRFLSILF